MLYVCSSYKFHTEGLDRLSLGAAPGTMLTAYVAGILCNVVILPGSDVGFTVAVNPRRRSITQTANIATVIIILWCNVLPIL